MHPSLRAPLLAAALAAALTGCAGSSPAAAPSPGGSSASGSSSTAAPAVRTVALTVAHGKVSGDTGRAVVELGSRVKVVVTADVVQEVHIHGYDLHVDTVVGQPVTKEFVASTPGVFEVELEQSKTLLTRLQVQ